MNEMIKDSGSAMLGKVKSFALHIEYSQLPVDLFSVPNSQHDNLIALHIKNHPIISDTKSIAAKRRIDKLVGIRERVLFVPFECLPYASSFFSVKSLHVLDRPGGID